MVHNIFKLVTTTVLITALIGGLSSNLWTQQVNTQSNIATPEAMLTVEYSAGTLLGTAINNIKNQLPKKNINSITIANISNKLDFDGRTQTFSKSNEDNKNSNEFVNSFKKSQNAFLKTLVGFKSADDKRQNYESKDVISPLIKKYSADTINRTQAKYAKNPATITGLTLSGSIENLNRLNNSTNLGATSVMFTNILEAQKQGEILRSKLVGITDEKQKMDILNQEIQKTLPAQLRSQQSNMPKLDLTQDQIKTIDQLVKKDISGNNFVDANLIKSKANLNDQQVDEVVKAMNNYNQLPTELKDGTINSVQATTATTTLKNVEKDEATPLEKVISFVSEFGNVKASAIGYGCYWINPWINWGGMGFEMSSCIKSLIINGSAGALWGLILTAVQGYCIYAGPYYPLCIGLSSAIAGMIIWGIRDQIVNRWCPNNIYAYISWNQTWGMYAWC